MQRHRQGFVCSLLVGLAPLLSACPTSEGPSTPTPTTADPFGANVVPGAPSVEDTWTSPSSLGNGMVHDTRYDLDAISGGLQAESAALAAGISWDFFVGPHKDKLNNGFRPAAIDADITVFPTAGTPWISVSLEDRSTYISDDDAAFESETKLYMFDSLAQEKTALTQSGPLTLGMPRPTAIDHFSAGGLVGTSVTWTHDGSNLPWRMVVGESEAGLANLVTTYAAEGYRVISLASRERDGNSEYAAIWVADGTPASRTRVSLGEDWSTLTNMANVNWADGYYPARGTYEQGSEEPPRFNFIWTKAPPNTSVETRYDMGKTEFDDADKGFRQQGYHLENGTTYLDGGETRHAGVWVRSTPYWHPDEQGDTLDPLHPKYATWMEVEDVFKKFLSVDPAYAGTKSGEFFRPSGTLHIFEGNQLILDRAYTYAPATYPATPLDAPMPLASVSKSITSVAVQDVLDDNGLPLSNFFNAAAGINGPNVPAAMDTVPVYKVLNNRGGFNLSAPSYMNHSIVDASVWGSYPISIGELRDYIVEGDNLDSGELYWAASEVDNFHYSNPGYSLLGELVEEQSGMSYEQYVRTQMLVPLGLDMDIFVAPAKRMDVPEEPVITSLRSYLVNDHHPYLCSDGGCVAQNPVFGSAAPPPSPNAKGPLTWTASAAPMGPGSPAMPATLRYGGEMYLGSAPLPAAGWHSDGESLGRFIRDVLTGNSVLSQAQVDDMLHEFFWVRDRDFYPAPDKDKGHSKGNGWAYSLGWYVRGNWVAMGGGFDGSTAVALYNREFDVTIVMLANGFGQAFADLLNPMIDGTNGAAGLLGNTFPCVDVGATPYDECDWNMDW